MRRITFLKILVIFIALSPLPILALGLRMLK